VSKDSHSLRSEMCVKSNEHGESVLNLRELDLNIFSLFSLEVLPQEQY